MIKNNFQKLIKLSLFFTLIYTLGFSEKEDSIIEKVSNINGKVTNECGFPIEDALIQFYVNLHLQTKKVIILLKI